MIKNDDISIDSLTSTSSHSSSTSISSFQSNISTNSTYSNISNKSILSSNSSHSSFSNISNEIIDEELYEEHIPELEGREYFEYQLQHLKVTYERYEEHEYYDQLGKIKETKYIEMINIPSDMKQKAIRNIILGFCCPFFFCWNISYLYPAKDSIQLHSFYEWSNRLLVIQFIFFLIIIHIISVYIANLYLQ